MKMFSKLTKITLLSLIVLAGSAVILASHAFAESKLEEKGSIGLGLGIPFGILGINGEWHATPNIAVTAGVGSTLSEGLGYSAGMRYYFGAVDGGSRFRLSALYGTNTIILKKSFLEDETEVYSGLNLGFGWLWKSGWEFDVIYMVSPDFSDIEDDLNKKGYTVTSKGWNAPVKISVGYRF